METMWGSRKSRSASDRHAIKLRTILASPDEEEVYAYFPTEGICSVIAVTRAGTRIETGLIGKEGFVGGVIVLHAHRSPYQVMVQADGLALRISRNKLTEVMEVRRGIQSMLLRFIHTFMLQTAQTALANGHHTIETRLARWILMYHDRVQSKDLLLTHDFLSIMLAVRRAGVTDALHILEGKHAIRATRGLVHIIDRPMLEIIAGDAYGVPENEYEQLIGQMCGHRTRPSMRTPSN